MTNLGNKSFDALYLQVESSIHIPAYFAQNNRTIILPSDNQRTTSELPDVGAKLEAWRLKMFHNFHFLYSDMIFGIINSFS